MPDGGEGLRLDGSQARTNFFLREQWRILLRIAPETRSIGGIPVQGIHAGVGVEPFRFAMEVRHPVGPGVTREPAHLEGATSLCGKTCGRPQQKGGRQKYPLIHSPVYQMIGLT